MWKVRNNNSLLTNSNRYFKSTFKFNKLVVFLLILIIFSGIYSLIQCNCASLEETISQELLNIDFSRLNELLNDTNQNVFKENNFYDLVSNIIQGKTVVSFNSVFSFILSAFLNKFYILIPALALITIIAVFSALIDSLGIVSFNTGISDIIYMVCFCAVISIIIGFTYDLINDVKNTIFFLKNMIDIMSPIIVALMIAGGGTVSATIYQPTMVFMCNFVATVFVYLILPIVSLMVLFSVISNFSSKIKLKKFSDLFRSICKWVIGGISAIFGLLITVQGLTASAIDGMSLKVLKYTISSSLPIVGSLVGGSVDFILAGAVMIKCGIGFAGIILALFNVLTPLMSILSLQFFLKLLAAVLEPFAHSNLINFFSDLSCSLNYLNTILITFGLMLFILLVLVIISINVVV